MFFFFNFIQISINIRKFNSCTVFQFFKRRTEYSNFKTDNPAPLNLVLYLVQPEITEIYNQIINPYKYLTISSKNSNYINLTTKSHCTYHISYTSSSLSCSSFIATIWLYICVYIYIYIYIYICNSSKILNQSAQWVERFIYLLMVR